MGLDSYRGWSDVWWNIFVWQADCVATAGAGDGCGRRVAGLSSLLTRRVTTRTILPVHLPSHRPRRPSSPLLPSPHVSAILTCHFLQCRTLAPFGAIRLRNFPLILNKRPPMRAFCPLPYPQLAPSPPDYPRRLALRILLNYQKSTLRAHSRSRRRQQQHFRVLRVVHAVHKGKGGRAPVLNKAFVYTGQGF